MSQPHLTPFDALAQIASTSFDNSKSTTIVSPVPDICRSEPCCFGIDEAGRGPVLGPMVYGVCYCPVSMMERLQSMDFDDSKKLDEDTRDKLFANVNQARDFMGFAVKILSPQDISSSMLQRSKYNLNSLSHDTAIGLIQLSLDNGVNITEIYVDTVGVAGHYEEKLSGLFPSIKIRVTPKADSLFPIVSAASICAKVVRDHVLRIWQFQERNCAALSREFGCGYPSDPTTKEWLQTVLDPVFGFPGIVRFSWATCKNILQEKGVAVAWEDDEEDTAKPWTLSNQPTLSFAKPSVKRHKYFIERKLESVVHF